MEQNNSESDGFADLIAKHREILWFEPVRICMNLEDGATNGVARSLNFDLRLESRCKLLGPGDEPIEGLEFSLLLKESNCKNARGRFSHWPPSQSSFGEDNHTVFLDVQVSPGTFQSLVAYCSDGRLPASVRVDVKGLLRGPGYDGGDYRLPKVDGCILPVVGVGFQLPLVDSTEVDEDGVSRPTAQIYQPINSVQLEKLVDRLRVTVVERSRIIISWMVVILLVLLFK